VAYGWVVGTTPNGTAVDAIGAGTDYGFTSDLRLYPATDDVTVALSNDSGFTAMRAGEVLATSIPA
jgi:hypothetical protein